MSEIKLSPNDTVIREFVVWSYKRTLITRKRDVQTSKVSEATARIIITVIIGNILTGIIVFTSMFLSLGASGSGKAMGIMALLIVMAIGAITALVLFMRIADVSRATGQIKELDEQLSILDNTLIPDKLPPI